MVKVNKMVAPAFIAGFVAAFFAAIIRMIPVVHICSFACCLWLMGGGVLATYLLKRSVGKIELKDGAIVGALSGVYYTIVNVIFIAAIFIAFGVVVNLAMPEGLENIAGPLFIVIGFVGFVFFSIALAVGVVFGAVGGVLGAKLLEK